MRKVFLDDLPHGGKYLKSTDINWFESHKQHSIIRFIYDDIVGWIEIIDYIKGKHPQLIIKYKNNLYKIKIDNFAGARLGKILNKITSDFKYEVMQRITDDKRDITITNIEYRQKYNKDGTLKQNEKWYKYTCNVCGWTEGWIIEGGLKTNGCSCCTNQTPVLGINTIYDTDKWMIPIVGEECTKTHTYGSNDKVEVTCPDCGRILKDKKLINNIYKNKGIECGCSDNISIPNKIMFNVLEQLNIIFNTEYSPKWCKYLFKNKLRKGYYDFYIPSMNLIIEMDGAFHTKNNSRSGQTAEESKYIDDEKDRLAIEHNIEVIRIDCDYNSVETRFNYIKNNILESKLNILFDLREVDWGKNSDFTYINLVKIACNFRNINLTVAEISKNMKRSKNTIRIWLKIGNEIGWCDYNPKEELIKSVKNNGKRNGKLVEIFKDNVSLGIFESCSELDRQSEILFGVKLGLSCISLVCNGKRKTHKGYAFKYVEK